MKPAVSLLLAADNLRVAKAIVLTRDYGLARQMTEVQVEMRRMEKETAKGQLRCLQQGLLENLQTNSLPLDPLRDPNTNAHLSADAHPIPDESGLLSESRLRFSA
ncbi:hypothetical protein [Rhizobium sp. SL86]|uniref:hypothetical protein n=1 Tax=Rhizobium sp. SL86 TaxID=2995148 RepID=UPI00227696FE|nr:hypothetical protein [Rhizobium sp. SL86]MCY1666779.1 hypothetical protein [Rhizobium sp. SL86]